MDKLPAFGVVISVPQEDAPGFRKPLQKLPGALERLALKPTQLYAVPGEGYRGSDDFAELHRPVLCQGERQTCRRAWNGDRTIAHGGGVSYDIPLAILIQRARGASRRHFPIVYGDGLSALVQANQHETAAAEIPGRRVRNRQGKAYCHGGIHGVPSVFQDFNPGLCGAHFGAHNHPLSCADRGFRSSESRRGRRHSQGENAETAERGDHLGF